MINKNEIFKCEICDYVVETLHKWTCPLMCCGKEMWLLEEKTSDQWQEKHVPIVERDGNKVTVKVGSVAHPMETEHYIEWIEIKMVDAGRIAKDT